MFRNQQWEAKSQKEIKNSFYQLGYSERSLEKEIKLLRERYPDAEYEFGENYYYLLIAQKEGLAPTKDDIIQFAKDLGDITIDDIIRTEGSMVGNLVAYITFISEPKGFMKKNGQSGAVAHLFIRDDTGSIKLTLWNEDLKYIKNQKFKKGACIRIFGYSFQKNTYNDIITPQLSLGKKGYIEIDPKDVKYF